MIRVTNVKFGFFGNFKAWIRVRIRVFQNIRFGLGFVFDCFKIYDSDSDSYSTVPKYNIRIRIRIRILQIIRFAFGFAFDYFGQ